MSPYKQKDCLMQLIDFGKILSSDIRGFKG